MEEITFIKTIKNVYESKYKEKGSLFLGIAKPVLSIDEAEYILNTLKKDYFDATHHCYAYKIYPNIFKYSDDGEPTGTAGIRLLNAINHFDLTNILLISIRYFGGTKLGIGPLGKAYYQNGIETLENIEIITKELFFNYQIVYSYNLTKTVHHILNKYNCKIINTEYQQTKQITHFKIKLISINSLINDISILTNNQAIIKNLNIKELI